MVRRGTLRHRWLGVLGALAVGAALIAVPGERSAEAQTARLTIAPHYEAQRIDSPEPITGGQFGGNIQNAGDIDGDGVDDILVPETGGAGSDGHGLVRVISGGTGEHVYTVVYPDIRGGRPANFGGMVGRVADLGSCPGGTSSAPCPQAIVGARDGTPEFVVGAWNADLPEAEDIGAAYVYDGATGALLKRLQLPPDDIASQIIHPKAVRPFSLGRSVISPASDFPADAPEAVKIGDMNGGGLADIAVGDSSFYEEGPGTNPACVPGPCNGAGRVYFFAGEDIAGTNPAQPLDAPYLVVKNPVPVTNSPFYQGFSHTIASIGDVGGCRIDPGAGQSCPTADKVTDPVGRATGVVVSHIRAPIGDLGDAGRAWLVDGSNGAILLGYTSPEPQVGALWSYNQAYGGAIGDVGGSLHPDVVIPGDDHDAEFSNQGRAWVFSGNHRTLPGGSVVSILNDPTPAQDRFFGAPIAPIGDVAGDPRNEVLIGHLLSFGSTPRIGAAHIFSPATGDLVYTIEDPDQQLGTAFGNAVTALGDINGDGFVDFAVGNSRYAGDEFLNQGRLYIFTSAQAPPPDPDPDPDADPDPDVQGACPQDLVPTSGLADIAGNVHAANIECIMWHELTQGTSATSYNPDGVVTRSQMTSFIARMMERMGLVLDPPADQGFTDIAGNVHANRINQLAAVGVVQGTSATTFDPDGELRRDQMASYLVRVYEFIDQQALALAPTAFTDISSTNVHGENIAKAATAGWAQGTTATTFSPEQFVRRDQMASFLARVLEQGVVDGHVTLPVPEVQP